MIVVYTLHYNRKTSHTCMVFVGRNYFDSPMARRRGLVFLLAAPLWAAAFVSRRLALNFGTWQTIYTIDICRVSSIYNILIIYNTDKWRGKQRGT